MEDLFKELSKFARENRKELKSVEQWLNGNEFNGDLADAWEIAKNELAIDWRKIVFIAWVASDKTIYKCKFDIDGFELKQWCGVGKKGLSPQIMFLQDILSETYATKQNPNLRLIRNALEEGKKAQGHILPNDAIRIAVAIQKFHVSRITIKRAIKDGIIKSYRLPNAPKNSPHIVSESELARHYLRW